MSDAAAAESVSPAASLRVLLRGVVDYAGLFPPAGHSMAAAVEEYSRHRSSGDAWMLGRFVLPAARLEEFESAADRLLPRQAADWWALSALLSGDVEEDVHRVERFNERHSDARSGAALVDTVELKAHSGRDVSHASGVIQRQFDTYMEVPVVDDPAEIIAAIREARGKAKIRTGGTTPDAFPTSAQIVRFVARCIAHQVAFKATAGLHHPWRSEYRLTYAPDAPHGTMFGFMNVLLATAVLHHGASEREAVTLLELRDAHSARFTDDAVLVGDRVISLAALAQARESLVSFGSCSFAEPASDLRSLRLL